MAAPEPPLHLLADERAVLLDLADSSIRAGLHGRGPLVVDLAWVSERLRRPSGVFVTVTVAGSLNGCIGVLEPVEPVARAVPRLAHQAAFADPRLPPLRADQYDHIGIEVSLLGPPSPIAATSAHEVTAALRPGIDGLILEAAGRRATFLPAVWRAVPDPEEFVRRLLRKAGLAPGPWPDAMRAMRYTVEEFGTA